MINMNTIAAMAALSMAMHDVGPRKVQLRTYPDSDLPAPPSMPTRRKSKPTNCKHPHKRK